MFTAVAASFWIAVSQRTVIARLSRGVAATIEFHVKLVWGGWIGVLPIMRPLGVGWFPFLAVRLPA